jgi:hypothetical protein
MKINDARQQALGRGWTCYVLRTYENEREKIAAGGGLLKWKVARRSKRVQGSQSRALSVPGLHDIFANSIHRQYYAYTFFFLFFSFLSFFSLL